MNFASADIARIRLRAIIKADREAVPCGRWVKCPTYFERMYGWHLQKARSTIWGDKPALDLRQRCRYQVRR